MTRIILILTLILTSPGAHSQALPVGSISDAQCEDSCRHIHGIDISHYQGDVFWQTLGDNRHISYIYI